MSDLSQSSLNQNTHSVSEIAENKGDMKKPSTQIWLPFIFLMLVDVLAFLFDKLASSHAGGDGLTFYWNLLHQPWLWAVAFLAPVQLWLWKIVLSRAELSLAYPLSSLAYPLTMLASVLILKEHLVWQVWLGGLLITSGVALLNLGKKE